MLNQNSKSSLVFLALLCSAALSPLCGGEKPVSAAAETVDYALNGSFTKLNRQGTAAAHWDFWKRKNSDAKLAFEKNGGADGSTAAVLSGNECSLFSHIKIQPGEKICAKVKVKKDGQGPAFLTLRFQDAKRKWLPPVKSQKIPDKAGEWVSVEVSAVAPEGAGLAVPILEGLRSQGGTIRYCKFELYRLPGSRVK